MRVKTGRGQSNLFDIRGGFKLRISPMNKLIDSNLRKSRKAGLEDASTYYFGHSGGLDEPKATASH